MRPSDADSGLATGGLGATKAETGGGTGSGVRSDFFGTPSPVSNLSEGSGAEGRVGLAASLGAGRDALASGAGGFGGSTGSTDS